MALPSPSDSGVIRALLDSQGRHPSSARSQAPGDRARCSWCGAGSLTAAEAPDAVRQVLALAGQVLDDAPREDRPEPWGDLAKPLVRVARLRDELHAAANRVARFGYDDHPVLDSVHISTPTASSAVPAPRQLLFQLDVTATRLLAGLDTLTEADWRRSGRVDDRVVTLGDLVETVLHASMHDLFDLLHALPRVAPLEEGRNRGGHRDPRRPTGSYTQPRPSGATAS